MKIDPNRWSLSDCAAEIRNVVYKAYFRADEVRIFPALVKGQVLSQAPYASRPAPRESSDDFKHAAILLCSKGIYNEALLYFYDNKTFEIVDRSARGAEGPGYKMFRTPLLRELPPRIVSNIKCLSFDIEWFGFALARLNNAIVRGTRGQKVSVSAWQDALDIMPKLEVLTVQCHDWLEPLNLALRFVTNARMLCNTTDIAFELNVHGQDYEEGAQVEPSWQNIDYMPVGGPTDISIPAVKKLVVVGWLFPQELEVVKKITFGGQRFLESERSVPADEDFDESRYYTGNHRFHEIGHSKVGFKGLWPRQYEHDEIDTEISRYTYSLDALPVEEGMKSI